MNHHAADPPTHRPTDHLNSTTPPSARRTNNHRRHFAIAGGRAGRLRLQLSERDIALLASLRALRLMTGQQARRLFFPDGNPVTQARKARATLKRLAELRLIVRLRRRVGGLHAGSEGHVIGLSGLGHAVLDVGAEVRRRHRSISETKLAYQEHVLAVGQLLVDLTDQARAGRCELLQFDTEPDAWRHFGGVGGQRIILKPDAFVRLVVDEWEIAAFIEQDMDTESMPTISRKCQVYVDFWRTGQEQHDHGVFPRIWWLVPDHGRMKDIARVIQRLPHEARNLFAIVLTEEAADRLVQLPVPGGEA